MLSQRSIRGKTPLTEIAGERAFARVNSLVNQQHRVSDKGLLAHVTLVLLLLRIRAQV